MWLHPEHLTPCEIGFRTLKRASALINKHNAFVTTWRLRKKGVTFIYTITSTIWPLYLWPTGFMWEHGPWLLINSVHGIILMIVLHIRLLASFLCGRIKLWISKNIGGRDHVCRPMFAEFRGMCASSAPSKYALEQFENNEKEMHNKAQKQNYSELITMENTLK